MTALEAVATYLPDERVTIDDMAQSLALSPMQVRILKRHQGLAEVRADPHGTLVDLLARAAGGLGDLADLAPRIRYVLYARSLPLAAPYPVNPLDELRHRLGLERAVAFTVTHHACASGLLALHLAGRLLDTLPPDALALVVAGEKRFTRDAQVQAGTVFGEGAAACLVRASASRDRVLSYATNVDTQLDLDLPEVAPQVEQEYPDRLAGVVTAAVAKAGLRLSDVGLILPHNVNLAIWQRVCRRLDYPAERVLLDNVSRLGHTFCADAFVNYRTALERGLLRPGDRYLATAAGFARGATFAAMLFEH